MARSSRTIATLPKIMVSRPGGTLELEEEGKMSWTSGLCSSNSLTRMINVMSTLTGISEPPNPNLLYVLLSAKI